jgi:ankyrin repeat protein
MKMPNIERAIIKAAENGHAAAVSTLLSFSSQQGLEASSVITRWAVDRTINNGHAAVFEALASADPTLVNSRILGHHRRPLNQAVQRRQTEVVAVLLRLGADPIPSASTQGVGSYGSSLLYLAAKAKGTRMTELLLKHSVPVARSGALHLAAELGALGTMSLLIQHGADVNEQLTTNILSPYYRSLYTGWTPMHFAASGGQVDAMKLLESNGARSDVKDENGRTPAQLLEQRKP